MKPLDEVLDTPAAAGLRLVALGFLDEWLATLPRLHVKEDDEALHDYRVALRRLRSWLKTFDEGGGKAQRQLSDLQEETGGARDSEVMQEWLKGDETAAAKWALQHLQANGAVDVTRVDARTHKVAERLQPKLSRYSLEVPVGSGAQVTPFSWAYATALRRLHHDLIASALTVVGLADPDGLHKVRIRAKRLRYALAPLKDWAEAADAVSLLKERQELLGELHDRHAFELALERIKRAGAPDEVGPGLDGLLAKARAESQALYERYSAHRHASDVRLAALLDVINERLGRRMGLQVEVVPKD